MTTQATPPTPDEKQKQEKQQSALTRVLQSNLCVEMADKYKVAPDQLFGVLMRTVFPKNAEGKITATVEQFVAFLAVAQQYDLNPFTREIYAFPSKGGGVIPIVPVDGWVKIIQRSKTYDGLPALAGIRFVDEFEVDAQGKNRKLIAIKCVIKRRDMDETEITEYMGECVRPTEPWNKWPARMLRHKALIQCSRVAFGLSGIYDQDEAERIIEVEGSTGKPAGEILMPQRTTTAATEQRVTQIRVDPEAAASMVRDMVEPKTEEKEPPPPSSEKDGSQHTEAAKSEPEAEVEVAESAPLAEENGGAPANGQQGTLIEPQRPEPKRRLNTPKEEQIGTNGRKKVFAVLNAAKAHTEKELYAYLWLEYGIEHVHEIPKGAEMEKVLIWAGADKMKMK